MKLYELTENYRNLLELLENPDVPKEILDSSLKELEGNFNEKSQDICKVLKSLERQAEAIKAEEKRLAKRRKTLENNAKSLKSYLSESMLATGLKTIKNDIFTLAFHKNPPSLNIVDSDNIPFIYKSQETVIDTASIKADLKAGKLVAGAELVQKESLRIK